MYFTIVPTPIDGANRPGLRRLATASGSLGAILGKGDIVVNESTVYPEATEEVCVPILEGRSGLACGDFVQPSSRH